MDQQSGLAPDLKDFLKSVDGKTSPDQLVARWRDGPDALQLLVELERRGLVEVKAARWSNSSANSAFPSSFADSSPPESPSQLLQTAGRPAPTSQKPDKSQTSVELDAIKEQMATFMLTHLPHHAMTALKEIEDINCYNQLMIMLTGYASMAHEAGRTGLAHIKSLRAVLEPGFQRTAH